MAPVEHAELSKQNNTLPRLNILSLLNTVVWHLF